MARRSRKQWTNEEITQMRQLAKQNTPLGIIGRQLGRTVGAVRSKATEIGLSLRAAGRGRAHRRR